MAFVKDGKEKSIRDTHAPWIAVHLARRVVYNPPLHMV